MQGSESVPWLHVLLVAFSSLTGWIGFVAIEGNLSILLEMDYGWDFSQARAERTPSARRAHVLIQTPLMPQVPEPRCAAHATRMHCPPPPIDLWAPGRR